MVREADSTSLAEAGVAMGTSTCALGVGGAGLLLQSPTASFVTLRKDPWASVSRSRVYCSDQIQIISASPLQTITGPGCHFLKWIPWAGVCFCNLCVCLTIVPVCSPLCAVDLLSKKFFSALHPYFLLQDRPDQADPD